LIALLLVPASATAEDARLSAATRNALNQKIDLTYTVSGIGFPILSADFKIALARSSYSATSVIKTEGIAGLMMESRWDTRTEGAISASGLKPATYRADVSTSRGRGAVSVAWEGSQYRISAVPVNKPDRVAELRKNLKDDLPDPLTALITAALFSATTPCTGVQRVFDGRRIYDLAYDFDKAVIIKGNPHYNGVAYRCSVKHTPVAGQPPEEIAAERRMPSPRHPLWLAPVLLGDSGVTVLIPVKIELATDWGRTTVHLTNSAIDGRPIKPAKTASN
jgi:hypothetical protein